MSQNSYQITRSDPRRFARFLCVVLDSDEGPERWPVQNTNKERTGPFLGSGARYLTKQKGFVVMGSRP